MPCLLNLSSVLSHVSVLQGSRLHIKLNGLFPDTEIDWETYMYQIELYVKGERDYAFISGPTGPLVYVLVQHIRRHSNNP